MRDRPIIIVGLARSGTTYIANLLKQNGVSMYDWEVFHCEDADVWGLNTVECLSNSPKDDVVPYEYKPSPAFMSRLKAFKAQREVDGLWGFKDPNIAGFLPAYFDLWPQARYVCCVRNPFSAAWSNKVHNHYLTRMKDEHLAYQYAMRVAHICKIADMHSVNMHYFNYDADPAPEFYALGEHLGFEIIGWETFSAVKSARDKVQDACDLKPILFVQSDGVK